jgi:hypothetical protein
MRRSRFRYAIVVESTSGGFHVHGHSGSADSGDRPSGVPLHDDQVLSDCAPLSVSLTDTDLRVLDTLLAPLRAWTSPRFYGLENIPADGPVLLVGNHNLMGGIDAPLLLPEILRRRGRLIRGLAENVLMAVPGLRELLHHFGVVRGNRRNCLALLARGEAVIVFPGGGREAVRRKNEKHVLKSTEPVAADSPEPTRHPRHLRFPACGHPLVGLLAGRAGDLVAGPRAGARPPGLTRGFAGNLARLRESSLPVQVRQQFTDTK